MPARHPSPAPLASFSAALAKLPAKTAPASSGMTDGDRYRFAKWRAPGR